MTFDLQIIMSVFVRVKTTDMSEDVLTLPINLQRLKRVNQIGKEQSSMASALIIEVSLFNGTISNEKYRNKSRPV